jgi:Uma2 family endonuclease
MTALASKLRFTYRDYLLLPEGDRRELIDGDFLMTPAPSTTHQRIVGRLHILLQRLLADTGRGEIFIAPADVVLSDENVVQPDLLFVARSRAGIIKEAAVFGAPDLLVEILSASICDRDLIIKRKLYARYGAKEYWIVDPDSESIEVTVWVEGDLRTAAVYTRGETLQSRLLPDVKFVIDDHIFPAKSGG